MTLIKGIPSSLLKQDILNIFETEYCGPSGISMHEFLQSLMVPPLNSTIRSNIIDQTWESVTEHLREELSRTNQERLSGRRVLNIRPSQVLDTWICSIDDGSTEMGEQTDNSLSAEKVKNWVIVDIPTAESCLRGANIFSPGVIACAPRIVEGTRVFIFCDVTGACLRGRTAQFDKEAYFVGSGIAQVSRHDLFNSTNCTPSGTSVVVDKPLFPQLSLNNFGLENARFVAQNLPSCIAVHVLDPQPNETILDCCAAPGGKSLHLATLMKGEGRLMLIEKSAKRCQKMSGMFSRFSNVQIFCADSSNLDEVTFKSETFDRILVDAPCSASGLRPRLSLSSLNGKQLNACPIIQKRILRSVIPLLKPGGTLVYSTCSILQKENEDVVVWVLDKFTQLQLVAQDPHCGDVGFRTAGLDESKSSLLQRFHVCPRKNEMDTIGFFIAKFRNRF